MQRTDDPTLIPLLLEMQNLTAGVLAVMEEGLPLPFNVGEVEALQDQVEEELDRACQSPKEVA